MNKKRPVNLDLSSLKFPAMAIASILHRISGVLIFLLLPLILWIFAHTLSSEQSFIETKMMLENPVLKLLLWGFSAAMIYHIIAGIRHIVMDFGFGEHLAAGRRSAILVMVLAVIFSLILGIWLW